MKRSNLPRLAKLVKNYAEEERTWTGGEMVLEKARAVTASGSKPVIARAARPTKPVSGNRAAELEKYRQEICACKKCPLGKARLNFVFGVGNPEAEILFVGEGPGFDEDHKGEPFIGRAGQLLNKIIEAMGFRREDVYIANIVKCHPMIDPSDPEKRGNDRPPEPEEVAECIPYLRKQIEIISPKVICTLGSPSSKTLSGLETPISKLRGKWLEYPLASGGSIPMMPTYHPAALLRNPSLKKDVWEDMKLIMKKIGLKPTKIV